MSVYRDKKDGYWYMDYYFERERVREKVGSSKRLAEIALSKRKVEIAEGRFLNKKKMEKIKFEDFAQTFLQLHSELNKKPSSAERDKSLIANLNTCFAGKYLYTITSMQVEKYKAGRLKKVAPATVNRELACLKCMFNKAIEWGKVEDNPTRKVKKLRENNKRLRYLEKEEIKKLLDNCVPHLKPVVITALNTGMRKGELLNLKWSDIDFRQGLITLLYTKNNERREIPLNQVTKNALIKVRKHPDGPYVFCKKDGRPYGNLKTGFKTALRKAGIEDFRFHDLRHTFASWLIMLGIDLRTVQELMGHKCIEMTLRYAHLSPNHKKRAIDVLGKNMDSHMDSKPQTAEIEKIGSFDNILQIKELALTRP